MSDHRTTIGVVIACHNAGEQLRECLRSVRRSQVTCSLHIVVVDDGSTDGAPAVLASEVPDACVIRADGSLWWAGASNLGIDACLRQGCDAVMLLNPDVTVEPGTIELLWQESARLGNAIVAPLVLDRSDPSVVWEAGHTWGPLLPWLPLFWRSRYLFRHGTPVSAIPATPYETVSLVGRGGLIPRRVFEKYGLLDAARFPQYGGDAVLGIRAHLDRWPMYIVPAAHVRLDVARTGMTVPKYFRPALRQFWRYLVSRKHGERLRVLWHQSRCCVPWYAVVPNYAFWVLLNSFRYWQRVFRERRGAPS